MVMASVSVCVKVAAIEGRSGIREKTLPIKRASEGVGRAAGAIERFIERTLAPRLEEMAGEIRGLRGEVAQMDKRFTENITSLRNETIARIDSIKSEVNGRVDSFKTEVNAHIDSLRTEGNSRFDSFRTEGNSRFDSFRTEVHGGFDMVNSRFDSFKTEVHGGFDMVNSRFDSVNTRIDALSQRLDDALNIRERLVALETRFEASQKRNGS
jgi:hypothetical protein